MQEITEPNTNDQLARHVERAMW